MLDFCLRIIKPCWCLFGGIDGTRVSWFVVCFLLFLFKSLFWNMRDIHLRAAAASFLSHDQTRVLLLDEIFTGCKIKVSSGLSIVCFCLRKLKRLIAVQGRGWMSWWKRCRSTLCEALPRCRAAGWRNPPSVGGSLPGGSSGFSHASFPQSRGFLLPLLILL